MHLIFYSKRSFLRYSVVGRTSTLDCIRCRYLSTAPSLLCSAGAAETLVQSAKSAMLSINPRTLQDLEIWTDNFRLQYRNLAHAFTIKEAVVLFRSRWLRCSMRCFDSIEVTYFLGRKPHTACGIIARQLVQSVFAITDAIIHREHLWGVQEQVIWHNPIQICVTLSK